MAIDVVVETADPLLAAARGRPIHKVPLFPFSASALLVGPRGWLVGWSVKDAGGGAQTQQNPNAQTATGAALAPALADVAGSTTFVTGFDVDLGTPAAAAVATVQLAGITGAPKWTIVDTAAAGGSLSVRFPAPLSGVAITLNVPAVGGAAAANSAVLYGYTAPDAGASLELIDGADATGPPIAEIAISAGGFNSQSFGNDGIPFERGLFGNLVSGSVRGSIYVRV